MNAERLSGTHSDGALVLERDAGTYGNRASRRLAQVHAADPRSTREDLDGVSQCTVPAHRHERGVDCATGISLNVELAGDGFLRATGCRNDVEVFQFAIAVHIQVHHPGADSGVAVGLGEMEFHPVGSTWSQIAHGSGERLMVVAMRLVSGLWQRIGDTRHVDRTLSPASVGIT